MEKRFSRIRQTLFPERVDTGVFFPGGGRGKVLQHILDTLGKGMPLLHLSGAEGSGKTHLCHLIREKIHFTHTVVLLTTPSGSFDAIGRNIASALGEKEVNHLSGNALCKKLLNLISTLAEKGGTILIIIDDAEELNDDVLTFILRLARDTEPKGGVQFVLAGRLALGANPELFSAIRGEPLEQFTYTLQPLDYNDTASYLSCRLTAAGAIEEEQNTIFVPEAIARIHRLSCGNIRHINQLAEEALQNAGSDNSLKVLPGHVGVKPGAAKKPLEEVFVALRTNPSRYLRYGSAILLLFFVVVFAYSFLGKRSEPVKKADLTRPEKETELPVAVEKTRDANPILQQVDGADKTAEPIELDRQQDKKISRKIEVPLPVKPVAAEAEAKVEIQPQKATPFKIRVEENRKKRFTGGTILEKRKKATASWRSRAQRGRYTIQILMLESRTAEKELSQILDDEVYRRAQDNLYILARSGRPMQVFLYYGAYQTAQEAREARDRLPESLKKYTPFPLSIAAAVKKSRK